MTASTAVVHLVRRVNGLRAFEDFMASYERHDPAYDHDLVLVFKGFEAVDELRPYRQRAHGHAAHEVQVTDYGVDLTALLTAALQLDHERVCFVHSWTRPVAPDWLRTLAAALEAPRAGWSGATGSWASHRSIALSRLGLPSAYSGLRSARQGTVDALHAAESGPRLGLADRLVKAAHDLPAAIVGHPGFPCPHLRLTAFLIDRERLLSLRSGAIPSKVASYRLECGHRSWTTQLEQRGLATYVVGRDTGPLMPDRWPDADVFWQGAQDQLLVADQRTVAYDNASQEARDAFARYAWGGRARPG